MMMAKRISSIRPMHKYLTYLNYVARHKWFVFLECCKKGIIWRGLVHDLSKLRPSEFFPYANYFASDIKKGRDKTGYYKPTDTGDQKFDFAWLLHQKRNDHHWQWWVLPEDSGGEVVIEMSVAAVKEMVCDWRGAGRAQGTPDTQKWYLTNRNKMRLGPITRAWVECELFGHILNG